MCHGSPTTAVCREIVSDALCVISGHPDASKIQPGETVVVGDEVLKAMEPETPEAATLRGAAEQVLGRALPSDGDVLSLDLPHSLIIEGLIEERASYHKGNANWFFPN